MPWHVRTAALLGLDAVDRLARARVCVAGLGAVGSYAVEALARAGVGAFALVDFDVVRESNLNRQLLALRSTLGQSKAELAAARVADINPEARVEVWTRFIHADALDDILSPRPDLVLDCIDSLNPKVELLAGCLTRALPALSSMGAANRLDPDRVRSGDLFASEGCPLARFVRKRLRRRGFAEGVWCVYSDEPPAGPARAPAPGSDESRQSPGRLIRENVEEESFRRGRDRPVLGSLPTLTGIFGLRMAHEAIRRLAAPPHPGAAARSPLKKNPGESR